MRVNTFKEFSADTIVAEKNFVGALVEANIRNEDRYVPIKMVTATRGKVVRAGPIASLYEQGPSRPSLRPARAEASAG